MVHYIATYISNKIVIAIPSEKENYCIFIYAFEKMLSQFLTLFFLSILSLCTGTFFKMIIYIFFVVLLRAQTSGFHAGSPIGCIFISCLISMTCIYISDRIHNFNILLFALLISVAYICYMSPINHISLVLTPFEIICHKKRTYRILLCEIFLIVFLYLFPRTKGMSIIASLAIITVALFMVLSKITNQEVKDYD